MVEAKEDSSEQIQKQRLVTCKVQVVPFNKDFVQTSEQPLLLNVESSPVGSTLP